MARSANEAQYDLSREAAKISALSSKNLDKYEYLTGEDLRYKPSPFEKVKFQYSPLGMPFHKHLKKIRLKILLRTARVISIMIANMPFAKPFTNFTKDLMNVMTCH